MSNQHLVFAKPPFMDGGAMQTVIKNLGARWDKAANGYVVPADVAEGKRQVLISSYGVKGTVYNQMSWEVDQEANRAIIYNAAAAAVRVQGEELPQHSRFDAQSNPDLDGRIYMGVQPMHAAQLRMELDAAGIRSGSDSYRGLIYVAKIDAGKLPESARALATREANQMAEQDVDIGRKADQQVIRGARFEATMQALILERYPSISIFNLGSPSSQHALYELMDTYSLERLAEIEKFWIEKIARFGQWASLEAQAGRELSYLDSAEADSDRVILQIASYVIVEKGGSLNKINPVADQFV